MIGKLDRPRTIANAVATVKFLQRHANSNGKVGATGFCWGGGVTNALAVAAGSDLLAAAPYYGAQPPADQVPKIKARLVLHYAQNDDNINKGIDAYKEALDKAGIKYELFIYEGAQHAFNNDTLGRALQQGGRRPGVEPHGRSVQAGAGVIGLQPATAGGSHRRPQ